MPRTQQSSSPRTRLPVFKFAAHKLVEACPVKMHTACAVPEASNDDFAERDGYAEFMAALEKAYPGWFDELANAEAGFASREEMAQLMVTAPHPFLAGMLYGKLLMKMEIAVITGRQLA